MKIDCEFSDKGISISCFFAVPSQLNANGATNFIIDTGAQITAITEIEADRLNIEYQDLPLASKPTISVGGKGFARILKEVIFIFNTINGSTQEFLMEEIHIMGIPKPKDRPMLRFIPNLLGTDFLKKYNIKLVADYNANETYLEI